METNELHQLLLGPARIPENIAATEEEKREKGNGKWKRSRILSSGEREWLTDAAAQLNPDDGGESRPRELRCDGENRYIHAGRISRLKAS